MQTDQYIEIGKILRTHGVQGALRIAIDERYIDDFDATEVIFVQQGGQLLPFFIEEVKGGDNPILKLEDISTPEQARALTQQPIWLREQDLKPLAATTDADSQQYERLQGYQLHDTELGLIAPIEAILELPQQFLARCRYQGREVLIPLHPTLIREWNTQTKTLVMDLPAGLLEL